MKISAIQNNQNLTLILGAKHYHFTGEKADTIFDLAMKYKMNPTDENLSTLQGEVALVNKILHHGILEEDNTGRFYLKDSKVPMPPELGELLMEYLEKGYPVEAFINFWKLCMTNPSKRARDDFFKYVKRFGVTITDRGYAILYKSVERKEEADDELVNFVSENYTKVKRWKKSPKNYYVFKDEEGYSISKENSDSSIGNLQELHDNLDKIIEETDSYYTPWHKGGDYGNKIQLGTPVRMPREKCDPDISVDCSHGLHIGAREYVKTFGWNIDKIVLAVLVNPAHIVALPEYDHSKIRCCEYFPYAVLATGNDEWEEIAGGYYEEDYCDYEYEELERILSEYDEGEIDDIDDEVLEILDNRLIDISL